MTKNLKRNASALIACGLLALAGTAQAGGQKMVDAARMQYERDKADCMMGRTGEPRNLCLKEAGAAYALARKGQLISQADSADQWMANALKRCDAQRGDDRELCIRRVRGEGVTDGSVAGGGESKSLTVRTVDVPKTPG